MTRTSKIVVLATLLMSLLSLPAWAGGDDDAVRDTPLRPTLSMFTADVGWGSVYDSYLAPLAYDGLNLSLGYEAMRAASFSPHDWLWQATVAVDYDNIRNPAGNNHTHLLMGDLVVDLQHRWHGVDGTPVDAWAGPMMQVRGGVIYNPSNSNNTVSAQLRASVGVTGMAAHNTRLWRVPMTLRYQLQLPVLGVFFAPEYDESYYEIYLGNHRNLAHVGWWGNRLDMSHYLGADLHLGSTIVRVGYRCRVERSWVNNLHVHNVSHSVVLGIGGEFLGLGRKPRLADRQIISPLY